MNTNQIKQILKEHIREFLKEAGGQERGTMEVINTSTEKAYEYAKEKMPTLDKDIPDFKKNYEYAQKMAGTGRTQRKDMPVIDDKDIQQFQQRLKKGYIDINEPFSPTYDKRDPYPKGLRGFEAEDFLQRGLKDRSKEDDMVEVTIKQIRVGDLKPIQKQIYFDKAFDATAKFGVEDTTKFITSKTFFVTSDDNYIIDGHHRYLSAILINPNMKVNCLSIDLPIKELLPMATAYGDAIGNKRNEHRIKEATTKPSEINLRNNDYELGKFITDIKQIQKGREYAIVDLGMNQWMVALEYKGIKNGKHYFKSTLQMDDFDISYPEDELKEIIKDYQMATCYADI